MYKKQFVVGMVPQSVAYAPHFTQMIPEGLTSMAENTPKYLPLRDDTSQLLPPSAALSPYGSEQPLLGPNVDATQLAAGDGYEGLQELPSGIQVGREQGEDLSSSYLRPVSQSTAGGVARDGSSYLPGLTSTSLLNQDLNPSVYNVNPAHLGAVMDSNVVGTKALTNGLNSVLGTGMSTDTLKTITDTSDLDQSLKAFNSRPSFHGPASPDIVPYPSGSKSPEANFTSQETQVKLIEAANNKALDEVKEAEYKNTVKNAEMAANLAQTAQTLEKLIRALHAQRKAKLTTNLHKEGKMILSS